MTDVLAQLAHVDLIFWIEVIGLPCFAMFLNLLIRNKAAHLPATGLADWLLLVIVFDSVAIFRNEHVAHHVTALYRASWIGTLLFMMFAAIVVWCGTVIAVEPKIERGFDRDKGEYAEFPTWYFVSAWAIAIAVTGSHAMLFIWE